MLALVPTAVSAVVAFTDHAARYSARRLQH